jgi:hypothetical protein
VWFEPALTWVKATPGGGELCPYELEQGPCLLMTAWVLEDDAVPA